MNTQTILLRLLDNMRGSNSIEESQKLIITAGAALALETNETLAVLKLGEHDIRSYLQNFCEKREVTSLIHINKHIKLLEVFDELKNIFTQNNESREKFGKILMDFYIESANYQRYTLCFTENPSSVNLLVQLTELWKKDSLFDGAAGIGYSASSMNAKQNFLGDINSSLQEMSKLLFSIMGKHVDYKVIDTLVEAQSSKNVDLVVTHPPYGMRLNYKEEQINKDYLLIDQTIPSSASDSLWIQQGLYQLNSTGKMIIQMAMGWLFRSGYDLKLRNYLIENRLISGIVFLPESLSPGTMIGTVLVILDKSQSTSVKLIDARNLGTFNKGKGFKILNSNEINKIVSAFENGDSDPQFCKDVSFQQIRENEYNLSANKYFYLDIEVNRMNLSTESEKLVQLETNFIESSKKFNEIIEKLMG